MAPQTAETGRWGRFWYRPESSRNLGAARVLLSATALWMALSRPDLPSVLGLPPELLFRVTQERRVRFLLLLPLGLERALYGLLHATLAAALFGLASRPACFLSGLLLYHFAPLETIIRTGNPYLRGFTIPALGLLVLSFGRCGDALSIIRRSPPETPPSSWRHRWPLALVQVLFCQIYLFAGYSKLVTSGLTWASGENMRGYLLLLNQGMTTPPEASVGYAVAGHTTLCAAIAWAGLAFELAFPLVLFFRRARWVLLPAAVAFHGLNALLFRIAFQNLPLLALFVEWDRVLRPPRGAP